MQDGEMYILSSISKYLSQKNYYVYSNYDIPQYDIQFSQVINNRITQCDLFIGIASFHGIQSDWIMNEWELAQRLRKTAIFLVEDTIELNPKFVKNNSVILFNRQYPQNSLRYLETLIERGKKDKPNAFNWLIGGLIGIAIIKLLSDDE